MVVCHATWGTEFCTSSNVAATKPITHELPLRLFIVTLLASPYLQTHLTLPTWDVLVSLLQHFVAALSCWEISSTMRAFIQQQVFVSCVINLSVIDLLPRRVSLPLTCSGLIRAIWHYVMQCFTIFKVNPYSTSCCPWHECLTKMEKVWPCSRSYQTPLGTWCLVSGTTWYLCRYNTLGGGSLWSLITIMAAGPLVLDSNPPWCIHKISGVWDLAPVLHYLTHDVFESNFPANKSAESSNCSLSSEHLFPPLHTVTLQHSPPFLPILQIQKAIAIVQFQFFFLN